VHGAPVFEHAVASFDPTATAVLLWTRLGGGHRQASWVVARDPDLSDVVARGEASTGPDRDGTVVVDVAGLEPATSYWYRFVAGGQESPVGRTRTLPEGRVERFRLGTVCCAHYAEAPFGVYRALAEREVDLVLHLGDYFYEEAAPHGHRPHDPPHDAVTLDDYRRRLAQVRADPDTLALHLRHPTVVIWDDHDVCDNTWRDGAKRHDPARHGPWPARVDAAVQAHDEWLPSRRRGPDPRVIWRSFAIGDVAELILLDTRLIGRDEQVGGERAKALDDPTRSLLGDEQREWLADRLADDRRPWALVASGVVVNEIELEWPRALAWVGRFVPSGYAIIDGRVMHDDQWDGYPAERRWLVDRLRERGARGGRTVLLSGDVHSSWAFEGPIDATTNDPVAVELTTPAVASVPMGRARYPALWRVLDRAATDLGHVVWSDVTNRGYTVVEITPDTVRSDHWFVRPYDDDPSAGARHAAGFTTAVDRWPPALATAPDPPPADPPRAGLPADLPPRPPELRRVRRRHRVRVASKPTVAVAVAAAASWTALAAWSTRRRR
jgi:alkaline phosphatase D